MRSKKDKILLIEDDPTQIMIYKLEFTNFGYNLIIAESGSKGIEKARQEKPDLIFLDLVLGDMEGVNVLKEIKSNPKTKNLKVVVLTNLTKKGITEQCFKLGADDFLIKSKYIPREIVEKAERYLHRK